MKDADSTLHSCAQAVAEDELNPLEDIKCPFSDGEAFEKIPECISCKLIGRCAVDNSAPGTSPTVRFSCTLAINQRLMSPKARSCGNSLGVVGLVGVVSLPLIEFASLL